MTGTPSISIWPMPPAAGSCTTIVYIGAVPATLTVTWSNRRGMESPQSVVVGLSGMVLLDVPIDADEMAVEDEQGLAETARASVLTPC